jgi:hypothetical protein
MRVNNGLAMTIESLSFYGALARPRTEKDHLVNVGRSGLGHYTVRRNTELDGVVGAAPTAVEASEVAQGFCDATASDIAEARELLDDKRDIRIEPSQRTEREELCPRDA